MLADCVDLIGDESGCNAISRLSPCVGRGKYNAKVRISLVVLERWFLPSLQGFESDGWSVANITYRSHSQEAFGERPQIDAEGSIFGLDIVTRRIFYRHQRTHCGRSKDLVRGPRPNYKHLRPTATQRNGTRCRQQQTRGREAR